MSRVIDTGEMLEIQLGVELGRGDVGMPQHFLDCSQILSRLQHMTGKAVPEHMRMHMRGESRQFGQASQLQLNNPWADAFAPSPQKECCLVIGAGRWAQPRLTNGEPAFK